jgi:arylsulfatase
MNMRMSRIPLLLVLLCLTASIPIAGCGDDRAPAIIGLEDSLPVAPDRNVIVISFDALRADALGAYGFTLPTSPNIDAFAERSLVFDRAYTVAPVTPTSFAAAFTGMLPTRVFIGWNLISEDTLAERFTAAGYRTAAFVNNVQLTTERNFQRGFDTYEFYTSDPDESVLEKSTAWLDQHRDEKVFIWIHFLSPHSPYEYREMAAQFYDPDYSGAFERTTKGQFDTDDPAEIARIRSLYNGEVFYADSLFGTLIERLEALGFMDSSVVLLTADHGEEFKERGGFQHHRLTEENVHIPLIIYHPDVEEGARTDILTSNVDFFPTLLSVVGIQHEEIIDGRDLTRLETEPQIVVGIAMTHQEERWVSLRRGSHKLIYMCMPEEGRELYDLEADPAELDNIASEERRLADSLYHQLSVILGGEPCVVQRNAVRGIAPDQGLSEETIRALKSLGYIQ